MNNLIKEDFVPKVAIVVYSQGDSREHYLESRRIEKKENGYNMLEGKPLTKKLLAKMLEEIDTKKLDKISCDGFLPKNLIQYSNNNSQANITWYVKSSIHNLTFIESLGIKDGLMHLPTLLFKLRGNCLCVYAIKSSIINEKTLLYKAPFHNVYESGVVCMGSAKVSKSTDVETLMKSYEDAFFQSKFSHLHGEGSPIKGNLTTYIKKQIKSKKPFDKSVLLSTNQVIKDIL